MLEFINTVGKIFKMLTWLQTFDVEKFVVSMNEEYINAQATDDYGPAICAYYSHMGDIISKFYGDYWHFAPWKSANRIDKLHNVFVREIEDYYNGFGPLLGLELGCGFGHTVEWMMDNTNFFVSGITLSKDEVLHAKKEGLFVVQGDYHNTSCFDNQYSFVYAIYCLKYSNNLSQVFSEVYRILEPGGIFLSYEILTTEKYCDDNPEHKKIMENICRSTNMPPLHNVTDMRNISKKRGFELISEIDVSKEYGDTEWYYPFFLSTGVYYVLKSKLFLKLIQLGESLKIFPKTSSIFYERHIIHPPIDFVEGGKLGIITGCRLYVFKKI